MRRWRAGRMIAVARLRSSGFQELWEQRQTPDRFLLSTRAFAKPAVDVRASAMRIILCRTVAGEGPPLLSGLARRARLSAASSRPACFVHPGDLLTSFACPISSSRSGYPILSLQIPNGSGKSYILKAMTALLRGKCRKPSDYLIRTAQVRLLCKNRRASRGTKNCWQLASALRLSRAQLSDSTMGEHYRQAARAASCSFIRPPTY